MRIVKNKKLEQTVYVNEKIIYGRADKFLLKKSLKMKHVLICTSCFFIIFLNTSFGTIAADEIRIYVDEQIVVLPDQKPIINQENRTLVPIRFVSEALGAYVSWDGYTQAVSVIQSEKIIKLKIGEKSAGIGNNQVSLDTAAALVNNRTMVPLRFISECLGAHVEWNGNERAVYITKELPPAHMFSGQPYCDIGLPVDNTARVENTKNPAAKVQFIETADLPVEFGSYTIYNIVFGYENVRVKQYSREKSPCTMYIAENGRIKYACMYTEKKQPSSIFTYPYPIWDNLSLTAIDSKNISHVMFETFINMEPIYLIVKNPMY